MDEKTTNDRIIKLEAIIRRQQFIEDRYEELKISARRVLRYNGVDNDLFNASARALGVLIIRHDNEINDME